VVVVQHKENNRLDHILDLIKKTNMKHDDYQASKHERDEAIRDAISAGTSMYAIAKATGFSETAIAKIRDYK